MKEADNMSYEFVMPRKVITGKGALQDAKNEFQTAGEKALIGIGGGSPLDSMIAIPTTAGTGSEARWFTVITDTKTDIKMLLKGPVLMPDVAIVDYIFTMTSPRSVTAVPGLDALTHAVEGYTSKKAQPLTDTFAKDGTIERFAILGRKIG